MPFWVFSKHCRLGSRPEKKWNTSVCNHLTHWLLGMRLDRFYIYICIYMFQCSSKSYLTYGCFCLGGITHHKPFETSENMLTKDSHNTRNLIPYSSWIVCGFFNVPQGTFEHQRYLWDGVYGFLSLSEKTWKSNHLQVSFQRQHFLLSHFKNLSIGLIGVKLKTSCMAVQTVLNQLSHCLTSDN